MDRKALSAYEDSPSSAGPLHHHSFRVCKTGTHSIGGLMQPHQERVIKEKSELDNKIVALVNFIHANDIFKNLPADEQQRMRHQRTVMQDYSDILAKRIAAFSA